ncbi:acetoacetate decarboxylase family protein [Saccharomonospora xinjiangensis]|uniref:Acetoacetate decarboxylase n=1 Tax=Saccharomonospora xinjiangensis XJ-54 TaxID=882086 RepID=I0UX71_9PSEU|nr:acetoacetate decarboxylase family protein [Saccharomonospora xinjiangensis]EID52474.1 acetoacetate decarboxylase [Saccharomonospora xinjiangensis XJ-54]
MNTAYPGEPWRLAGEAYVSVWAVPLGALPRVSDVVTPHTVGGRAVVVTAWIDYTPPGQLSYHELLAVVAVRHGRSPAGSITEIWVDSETSLRGGRALWGIPKELATFHLDRTGDVTVSAATPSEWIASATFVPKGPSGPATRARFSVIQSVGGLPLVSPVLARVRPRPASATWTVNPDGPLGYLGGRRPLVSVHLRDARLLFGRR